MKVKITLTREIELPSTDTIEWARDNIAMVWDDSPAYVIGNDPYAWTLVNVEPTGEKDDISLQAERLSKEL